METGLVVGCAALGFVVGGLVNHLVEQVPDRRPVWPPQLLFTPPWRMAVAVANAVLFALAANRFESTWVLPPFLLFFAALLTVSVIDIQVLRIPDRIVFPTLAVAIPAIVAASLAYDAPSAIRSALIGSITYFAILFIPHLISPRGMGFGDVKLAAVMGLHLGWLGPTAFDGLYLILIALFLGSILGVVLGVVAAVVRRKRGAFPFGPALALGAVVVALSSNQLLV